MERIILGQRDWAGEHRGALGAASLGGSDMHTSP
jgi:hypothetical protein